MTMLLCDVNVLLHAFHEESVNHSRFNAWLTATLNSGEPFALSELVLSSVVRIATHPKIFRKPARTQRALQFCNRLREAPLAVPVAPGPRHWSIFQDLCIASGAVGNLVPDAYLAALAIEQGCEWITMDRDYARFEGLRWRQPF